MASTKSRLSAANPAVTNRFVVSVAMKVGAYTVANATMPTTPGGRRITIGHTTVAGTDTLGTVAVVGTDLHGATITDTITPVADSTATGTKFFVTVTSVTGAGWVAVSTADNIVVGCEAGATLLDGQGTLQAVVVNTTAAGTVTLTDGGGAFAVLKASIAEGTYYYPVDVSPFLQVTLGAASDVTVLYTAGPPTSYAL